MVSRGACVVLATAMLLAAVRRCGADDYVDEEEETAVQHRFILEHSTNGGLQFTQRGHIEFATLATNRGSVTQSIEQEDFSKINTLADLDQLYHVRIRRDGAPESDSVSGFVKACVLQSASYAETLVVSLDTKGNPQGLEIKTSSSKCTGKKPSKLAFKTTAISSRSVSMPSPFTEAIQAELERKMNQAKGQPDEVAEQSFFSKYWMYIVPGILVIQLLAQSPKEEAQAAPGGGAAAARS